MVIGALEADTVGVLAGRILPRLGEAVVVACFERSFYLDVGNELIAVADPGLHDGPLTVRMRRPLDTRNTQTGERWTASPDRLRRDDGLTIDLTTARRWQPAIPNTPPDPLLARAGLERLLDRLQARRLPEDGLIGLVIDDQPPRNAIERAAQPPIDALRDNLPRWFANHPVDQTSMTDLIGLGPGLTPSGDDLLGGVLIICRHLGANAVADDLADHFRQAAANTNRISQAHLAAAAEGYGAAPLHDLLHTTLDPSQRSPRGTLDAVAEIGHSSGLDALAGMVLALTAWLSRT